MENSLNKEKNYFIFRRMDWFPFLSLQHSCPFVVSVFPCKFVRSEFSHGCKCGEFHALATETAQMSILKRARVFEMF